MTDILMRVRASLAEAGFDALYVSCAVEDSYGRHSQNRRYLSGFSGSTGQALVTADRAILAVDSRYVEQAKRESAPCGFEIWQAPPVRQREWLRHLFGEAGLSGRTIGLSKADVSLSELVVIQEAIEGMAADSRPAVKPAPEILEELRKRKSPDEVAALQRAIDVGDRAYNRVAASLQPGMREADVALAVEAAVRAEGGQGLSFETIVAAGPRASMPHAQPGIDLLRSDEMVVIDMGALWGGYCSDLTRTTFLGSPSVRFLEVYEIVFEAQRAALEGVEAGMPGPVADRLARDVIERRGYGDRFGHGLGHGVGLQIHEAPYLGRTSEDTLEDGMVFTIEPGIYIPGWGGVRIEDVVVLEGGRPRVLSHARKLTPAGVFS